MLNAVLFALAVIYFVAAWIDRRSSERWVASVLYPGREAAASVLGGIERDHCVDLDSGILAAIASLSTITRRVADRRNRPDVPPGV